MDRPRNRKFKSTQTAEFRGSALVLFQERTLRGSWGRLLNACVERPLSFVFSPGFRTSVAEALGKADE